MRIAVIVLFALASCSSEAPPSPRACACADAAEVQPWDLKLTRSGSTLTIEGRTSNASLDEDAGPVPVRVSRG